MIQIPARAGALNFSVPGRFAEHMRDIVKWFAENPSGDEVHDLIEQ